VTAIELDPDVRLYAQLTLGRGLRRATIVGLWTIAVIGLASGYIPSPFGDPRAPSRVELLLPALFILLLAPARAITKLFDLERGGPLDQTRMCGRPPRRILAAFAIGSTAPYVLAAAVLLAAHLRAHDAMQPLTLAAICFFGAFAAGLVVYGTLPAAMAPDSRFGRALLLAVALSGAFALDRLGWLEINAPSAGERATMWMAFAACAPAAWMACRRIRRAAGARVGGGTALVGDLVRRVVPRAGTPEFARQLRCTLLSGGTLATILVAPVAAGLIGYSVRPYPADYFSAVPVIVAGILLIGGVAASMTARREIETRTLDFVRITPQTPEQIAISWYAALAMPFWIAALLAFGAAWLAAPAVARATSWHLIAFALLAPAVTMAEGFQRRAPGTYIGLMLLGAFPLVLSARVLGIEMQGWQSHAAPPWNLHMWTVVPVLLTVAAIGVAAGRIRRASGPALDGLAAGAAVAVVALAFRGPAIESYIYPRLIVAVLALAGSFAASEAGTPEWPRIGLLMSLTAAIVGALAMHAGLQPTEYAATGLAAALALGASVLVHELLWRVPLLSLAARIALFLAILRLPVAFYVLSHMMVDWGNYWIPPMFQPIDLAALAVVFAALAYTSAAWRTRRSPKKR